MRDESTFFVEFLIILFGTVISVCTFIIACTVDEIADNIRANENCIVHNNEKYCREN